MFGRINTQCMSLVLGSRVCGEGYDVWHICYTAHWHMCPFTQRVVISEVGLSTTIPNRTQDLIPDLCFLPSQLTFIHNHHVTPSSTHIRTLQPHVPGLTMQKPTDEEYSLCEPGEYTQGICEVISHNNLALTISSRKMIAWILMSLLMTTDCPTLTTNFMGRAESIQTCPCTSCTNVASSPITPHGGTEMEPDQEVSNDHTGK